MFLFLFFNGMTHNTMDTIVKAAAQKHHVPEKLLKAIIRVESHGHCFAVNAKRRSLKCPSKNVAIEAVKDLHKQGIQNINVGPMQINLKYHKHASVEHWFDPAYNIDYGAKFLKRLYDRFGSWKMAVSYFHAGNKAAFYGSYIRKINSYLGMPIESL